MNAITSNAFCFLIQPLLIGLGSHKSRSGRHAARAAFGFGGLSTGFPVGLSPVPMLAPPSHGSESAARWATAPATIT